MEKEKAKEIIEEVLKKMGCEDVVFKKSEDNSIYVVFNYKEITSFVTNISGWTSSGIQLDPTKEHQYKIEFNKLS